ncbi:LacI family DNA-binding transcriptional regulator [Kouleothrix sp.]|uniref:LacI family DNA-binding transcriptional regulator n=1 Tax=Kouleothrix sp. TaxID=2779161 RepID=UPI00391DC3D3
MAATIKQVAELADVSTATVSYVLNGTGTVTAATRQRVLDAVAQLNYQPSHAARSMRGRSHTLGLVLAGQPGRLADPALADLLAGLTDAAALRGYYMLLANAAEHDEAELCVQLARTGRVDGLLLLDMQLNDARARALSQAGIAHVCAGPPPEGSASPFVMVDGRAGAQAAMRHLLSLGHRRIGLIQLPSELAESEPRYLGYLDALAEAGLPLDEALIVEAGRREEDGYQAIGDLLATPQPPTAVLACSDELAFGAMHALYDAGLEIGRDISLVGFDDLPLARHMHPPLTALRQPRRAVGEALAALLIDAIEQRPRAAQSTTLGARLIVRRSTGPAPT